MDVEFNMAVGRGSRGEERRQAAGCIIPGFEWKEGSGYIQRRTQHILFTVVWRRNIDRNVNN